MPKVLDIDAALDELNTKNVLKKGDIVTIARKYGVNRRTLSNCYYRLYNYYEQLLGMRLLTNDQEKALIKWICQHSNLGIPITPKCIGQRVQQIREQCGLSNTKGVGINWVSKFYQRYQDVLQRGLVTPIDKVRHWAGKKEALYGWFTLVQNTIAEYNIPPHNIYNFDETGMVIGGGDALSHRIYKRNTQTQKIMKDPNKETVTIIDCICGDGTFLPPAVIFKGVHHMYVWYTDVEIEAFVTDARVGNRSGSNSHDTSVAWFATSPKGWTTNSLGTEWVKRFEEHTRLKAGNAKRLLVFDGHGSHISLEFLEFCSSYNILPICMPPHSSHLLQPLDVGVFGPLQVYYNAEVEDLLSQSAFLLSMSKAHFWGCFSTAHARAMVPNTIKSAWRKAGLLPMNPRIVTELVRSQMPESIPESPEESSDLPIMPRTPQSVTDILAHGDVILSNPTITNIRVLIRAAVQARTDNQLLYGDIAGLRASLLKIAPVAKESGKRRRLLGAEQGHLYTAEDIVTMRSEVDAKVAESSTPKRRGRPKKVTVTVEPNSSDNESAIEVEVTRGELPDMLINPRLQ